jgi:hypothetical protein
MSNLSERISALVIFAITTASQDAFAQAWVGVEKSLSASLGYDFAPSNAIVETPSVVIKGEPIHSHVVTVSAEYVPIERLGITAQLPMVSVKYLGSGMLFPRHGRYDDGQLHTTLQDFRLTTRYQVLQELVALSPHLAATIPVADYETVGYANAGRGLKQVHAGVSVGRTLDPVLRNLYLHAQYEFTFSERYDATAETRTINQNRSDASFQAGYVISDKAEVNLGTNIRIPHGGINFIDWNMLSMDMRDYHDPLLRESFVLVGGGGSYGITENIRLNALARFFVHGQNTRNAHIFGASVSWTVL